MTDLTGFDESLAAVIARRRDGAPCPHTGEVFAPLPTDAANAAALVARARAATPGGAAGCGAAGARLPARAATALE